jgi:hypothetical protein
VFRVTARFAMHSLIVNLDDISKRPRRCTRAHRSARTRQAPACGRERATAPSTVARKRDRRAGADAHDSASRATTSAPVRRTQRSISGVDPSHRCRVRRDDDSGEGLRRLTDAKCRFSASARHPHHDQLLRQLAADPRRPRTAVVDADRRLRMPIARGRSCMNAYV